jgi:hypothetical protein
MIFGLKKLTCERKRFFFEKKAPRLGKQKTFANCGVWRGRADARGSGSFFASFFSKKEALKPP